MAFSLPPSPSEWVKAEPERCSKVILEEGNKEGCAGGRWCEPTSCLCHLDKCFKRPKALLPPLQWAQKYPPIEWLSLLGRMKEYM